MRIALILLLALVAGCASPTADPSDTDPLLSGEAVQGIRLTADRRSYRQGEDARLQLANNSSDPIGYNACSAARELWAEGGWVRIEPLRMCTAALYPLAAGDRAPFTEPITTEWVPGRYRVVLFVYRSTRNDSFMLASDQFDVTK